MTKEDLVALWRKEAREALRVADLAYGDGIYWLTMFHCHLAVEKALKAAYLEERGEDPPRTHELLFLAEELDRKWSEGDVTLFDTLGELAVEARYHDPGWAEKQATKEEALELARRLHQKLLVQQIPVHEVILFGSIVTGMQHRGSDIDIAVICDPFRPTRYEENMEIRKARRDLDVRISPFCLHPDDLRNAYWRLPREVKKYGVVA